MSTMPTCVRLPCWPQDLNPNRRQRQIDDTMLRKDQSLNQTSVVAGKRASNLALAERLEVLLLDPEVGLVCAETLVEELQELTWHLLADKDLDPVLLAGPQVLNELALAARVTLREAVGLCARKGDDIGGGVVVANVGTEATLVSWLAGTVGAEVNAVRVLAARLRALLPGIEDLVCLLVVLQNDETGVEVNATELVLVVGVLGVEGQSEGVGGGVKTPVVHEPLKGDVKVVNDGIGVHENAGVVVLEDLTNDGRLGPRCATVGRRNEVDEVVLVTVDLG